MCSGKPQQIYQKMRCLTNVLARDMKADPSLSKSLSFMADFPIGTTKRRDSKEKVFMGISETLF
jgi:hypothetical protein